MNNKRYSQNQVYINGKGEAEEINYSQLAEKYSINELQAKFAFFYVYLTNLNKTEAAKLAGYSCGNVPEDDEACKDFIYRGIGTRLLNNPKVGKLIKELRDEMEVHLPVDRLWVYEKLKLLAMNGSENTQLKATQLLGETFEMFKKVEIGENREDPAKIAAEKFEKRKANVVEFKKEG